MNYRNITRVHEIPNLAELNIGHAIIARALFVGVETAVREMLALMQEYRG
ncbi:MAG: pyridoxine 5'-phosphate synthase [Rhodanobacteraceae bacterium]